MYIEERSCGIIPFLKRDQTYFFLIVKHNDWHRWFPKGHVELDESEIETAKRELWEETGIDDIRLINNKKFLERYVIPTEWLAIKKTVIYFLWALSIDIASDINIKDGEILEYKIDNYNNIQKYLTFDSTKIILKNAFNCLNNYTDE
jgi:tRNA nucleotidyltransferase (CCA-adding enzyme)